LRVPVTASAKPVQPDAEAVWRDLRSPLLGFIARRVPDRDTAEDILQEVLLRIHRHASEITDVSAVGGWIHEIARNAIIDHYRRAVVRRERPVGFEIEPNRSAPAMPEPGTDALRAELAACLDPLLAQLPAPYAEALRLTDLGGHTQAEAATMIGLSTSGMKSRVQRGRAQLRALLTACCRIELDRRGGIIDYQPHDGSCDCQTGPPREQHPTAGRARRAAGGSARAGGIGKVAGGRSR